MEGRRRRRHDVFINGRYDEQTAPNWTMIYLIPSVHFGAGNVSVRSSSESWSLCGRTEMRLGTSFLSLEMWESEGFGFTLS